MPFCTGNWKRNRIINFALNILNVGFIVGVSMALGKVMKVNQLWGWIGLLSFIFGSLVDFNQSISLSDPIIWLETDLGSYPGLFAGIVVGQVLEKKHVNFNTENKNLTKVLLRAIIGVVSAVVLYLGSKVVDTIAEEIQAEILWITQVTNFLSFFVFGVFMAFIIPWLFTKIEKSLSLD